MTAESSYEIEPELRMETPRRARVKAGGRAVVRMFVLFALAGVCVIGWLAARDLRDLYALRAHGLLGQAVVTDKRMFRGKSNTYLLSYSLPTPPTSIEDEDKVPYALYEQKRPGDTLDVTFLPNHNQTHRVGEVNDERIQARMTVWTLVLLSWTGFWGFIPALAVFEQRKELRLARYGIPVPALIIKCVASKPGMSNTGYDVTYRLPEPFGERAGSVSNEIGKTLAAGQMVTALYDPADPRNTCLYCGLLNTELE